MASWSDNAGQGNFLPNALDFTSLDVNSPEFKIKLYQSLNQIILAVNRKTSGLYQFEETVDNNLWAPKPSTVSSTSAQVATQRAEFRLVVDFGALPNTVETPKAHGIAFDSTFTMTKLYAVATNPTTPDYLPIPYVSSVAADIIMLRADGTNVYIKTFKDYSAFTRTFVILEFLKN